MCCVEWCGFMVVCGHQVLHGGALDLRDLRSLRTEISLLCRLRHHPNIITVFGAAAAPPDQVALVTELMDCDLYDYIHRRRQVRHWQQHR